MFKKLFLILSIASILPACSKNQNREAVLNAQTGIIGGTQATATDPVTPSTVSIVVSYIGQPFSMCTGTLISRNLVLTATHCLKEMNPARLQVFVGENLPASFEDENIVPILNWAIHPEYEYGQDPVEGLETGRNDIALIRLAKDAPLKAKPVPVLNDMTIVPGLQVLLAGYGLLDETAFPPVKAKGLYYTRVKLVRNFSNILVTDQSNANGACAGDSGGPAYLETPAGLVVMGITRGPHDRAVDCRHYGEYTYASRYKAFILEKALELGAEPPVFVDAPVNF